MRKHDKAVFDSLFREACLKCFGYPLSSPLSETDSKLLSNRILDQTGLVIGAKSIKNYSFYLLDRNIASREENPSVATLDTFARYVLDAPHTDEVKRKTSESHFPYWFEYRKSQPERRKVTRKPGKFSLQAAVFLFLIIISGIGLLIIKLQSDTGESGYFRDYFNSVSEDSLTGRGWYIKNIDTTWWNKRNSLPGHLALFTLRGDNWSLGDNSAGISNLLMRKIAADCFTIEIGITGFIPEQNWQQAGILLSENSTFEGKMMRLSISYNDFFGGYEKPAEIIIQAISSAESGSLSKPEELSHLTLFTIEEGRKNIAVNNLAKSALKIEKRGEHYRFLYTTAEKESFAFREILSGDYNFRPMYVSIFAIRGWSENNTIPVYFDSFTLDTTPCDR